MAIGVNKVILIGHLGGDPEVRHTSSDLAVTKFSLATSEVHTAKDGSRETKTEWHRVVAFGTLANICGEFLKKGSMVYVEGKLRTSDWKDQKGNRRFTTEVIASSMQMLDRKDATAQPLETSNEDDA